MVDAELKHRAGEAPKMYWQVLLRLRWLLGGTIGLTFAIGRMIESLWFDPDISIMRVLGDVAAWGLLGGLAVWLTLTWVSRQEQRYQAGLEQALRDQQRAYSQLALLSEVNRRIVDSATLDEILDAALTFPQQLVPARATAVLLLDPTGIVETRAHGAPADELLRLRKTLNIAERMATARRPQIIEEASSASVCLALPLHDGMAPLGWIELHLERPITIAPDELALLETIAHEIAEAIASARRRSREERAIYQLERAIAEERARIARDIHDGIAQSLAFMRMRIDLWYEWIESDPQRLRAELIELKTTLREQIRELRRAIFALRPVQFDELGFVGGLRRYIVEFAGQHSWDVHVDLSGTPSTISPEVEAIAFRVVQEALTNAAKHAAASYVEVVIGQVDEGLQIVVRDNGRGFDPGALPEAPGHVGLRQMRERLVALRGQLTILSRPGAGTELRAWIPILPGVEQ
ncbi:GAF domain-containing sensor histidine kinase [Roseiflexus sp.]|uniref:sensor histidine kinase n=1 Tax=Roseiflexus sp. TaxID=2562120 RepID=UPI00398A731C